MAGKIQKRKIANDVAEALRVEIANGRWNTTLPGYRKLQEYFGVGRPAVVDALAILTEEGILLEAEPRAPRRLSGKVSEIRNPRVESCKRLRIVSHKSEEHWEPLTTKTVAGLRRGLGEDWSIETLIVHNYFSRTPTVELQRMVELNPSCLWLFIRPPADVVKWIGFTGLEAISLGGADVDERVPGLGINWPQVSLEMLALLTRLGHQRISFFCFPGSDEVWERYAGKLKVGFAEFGLKFHPAYNAPVVSLVDREKAYEVVQGILRHTPPTAVVCDSFKQYLVLLSCCAEKGLKIGVDLAVIVSGEAELSSWFSPRPTSLRFSSKKWSEILIQWALDPKSVGRVRIRSLYDLTPGDGLVPPR